VSDPFEDEMDWRDRHNIEEEEPMQNLMSKREQKPFREFQPSPSWLSEQDVLNAQKERDAAWKSYYDTVSNKPPIKARVLRVALRIGIILLCLASFVAGYWVGAR